MQHQHQDGAQSRVGKAREWCKVSIPFGHLHTNPMLFAMSREGMRAPFLLDGSPDGPAFLHWVENMLIKEVSTVEVFICDNAGVRRVAGFREALAKVGADLLCLPPYSPGSNRREKSDLANQIPPQEGRCTNT